MEAKFEGASFGAGFSIKPEIWGLFSDGITTS